MPGTLADNAVGPVAAQTFLRKFMQPSAELPRLKSVSKTMFHTLAAAPSGVTMHEELARIVNENVLCPKFELRTDAKVVDELSHMDVRPEVCLFSAHAPQDVIPDWPSMEFFLHIDPDESHDPFRATFRNRRYNLRNSQHDLWKDIHGRLTTYLTSQLSRQHRTFTFALCVFGKLMRFLRVDSAGVIVSSVINYATNPRLLAEFFWRYSHMSKLERGFDLSVVPASDEERKNLTNAIFQYVRRVDAGQARRLPKILRTLSKDYPAYRVSFQTESIGTITEYIIRRSFTGDRSLFGRGTRGFVALKLDDGTAGPSSDDLSGHLVFLKDSWRIDDEDMEIEAEIYEDPQEHGVSLIPAVLAAGDVYSKCEPFPQRTLTQEWAMMPQSWNRREIYLHAHVHHRVVQKLAYPLETVANARELIQVIRDALKCIVDSYTKTKRMHHNISSNNVMISVENGDVRGILNDWDISRSLTKGARDDDEISWVGTWRFMSMRKLRKDKSSHEIHDDLESLFWVLLFIALRHFKHEGRFDDHIFDHYEEGNFTRFNGAASKNSFLLFGRDGTFLCPALNTLITDISQFWLNYYSAGRLGLEEFNEMHDGLQNNPGILLTFFDKVLNSGDDAWVHAGWIPRHYPRHTASPPSSPLGPISHPIPASPTSRENLLGATFNRPSRTKRHRDADADTGYPDLVGYHPKRYRSIPNGVRRSSRR
ncbi:hypothetical protein K474DRAFT_1774871 [Panus rudis PR-1116 ss-1]|nr:hypothetical protein K474DRAFT_1774871 [Panus rudis PR-1116 ss-1]